MTSSKNTKRALLASVLSVALCCAMLVGSTFAWFTDSVTSTGNRIQAGNLEIDLLMDKQDGNGYVSIAGGEGDIFNEAQIAQNSNKTLWEPGKTQIVYLGVQNKGSLALRYNILLNVTDNGLVGALEYAVLDGKKTADLTGVTSWEELTDMEDAQTGDIKAGTMTAAPNGCLDEIVNGVKDETDYFALAVHMKDEAGNKYMGKDITIDVTVAAAQAAAESDSFDNTYDEKAWTDLEDILSRTKVADAGQMQTALDAGEKVLLTQGISASFTDTASSSTGTEKVVEIKDGTDINLGNNTISIESQSGYNGIYLEGTRTNYDVTAKLSNGTIIKDKSAGSSGATVVASRSTLILENMTITAETGTAAEGPYAVRAEGYPNTKIILRNCIVNGNVMVGSGAVLEAENTTIKGVLNVANGGTAILDNSTYDSKSGSGTVTEK